MSENPVDDDPRGADAAPDPADAALRGAVIVGLIPDQSPRVVKEAARYAKLLQAPLVVIHVDVTRFVAYEDPDGYVHSAPIDISIEAGVAEFETVKSFAHEHLQGKGVEWEARQLVGDPALALKHFADRIDARLLVVGTRKRGFGESIREFFTGSVAARLAHRQHRNVLIVPLGEPIADDAEMWPDEAQT